MIETGRLLKAEREKQKLSINEVSMATKINPKVILSMESGDCENLPKHSFLKGFVKSYALYLKLDEDQVLELFKGEMSATADQPLTPQLDEGSKEKPAAVFLEKSYTPRIIAIVSLTLMIVVIIFIKKLVDKYELEGQTAAITGVEQLQQDVANNDSLPTTKTQLPVAAESSNAPVSAERPKTKTENPSEPSTDKTATATAEIKPEPAAQPKEPIKPPETAVSLIAAEKEIGNRTRAILLAPIEKVETKTAPNPTPEQTQANVSVKPESEEKPPKAEEKAETSASLGRQEVIVEALDNIKIEFKIDNGKRQSVSLKPEQIHTFKGSKNLELNISDGGAANLIYNGRDKGPPGNLGSPVKLKYP